MSRKRFNIPSKRDSEYGNSKEETLNNVLVSIDNIQKKQQNISLNSPSKVSVTKIIIASMFVVIIGLGFLSIGSIPQDKNDSINQDFSSSLDFSIQLLDSTQVKLSDYVGKQPILLDLFATWCPPCIEQIEEFQKVRINFPNVQIISVTIDTSYDDISRLINFRNTYNMSWLVGRDITQKGAEIYLFPTGGIPTLAFFNSDGKLVQRHEGFLFYSVLYNWIVED